MKLGADLNLFDYLLFITNTRYSTLSTDSYMKSISVVAGPLAAVLAVAALTACATGQDITQKEGYAGSSPSMATPGAMMSGSSSGQPGMMDRQSMCDMHAKMMSGRTPEERQAMMNEHMGGMSPEMREQRMRMMQQQCK